MVDYNRMYSNIENGSKLLLNFKWNTVGGNSSGGQASIHRKNFIGGGLDFQQPTLLFLTPQPAIAGPTTAIAINTALYYSTLARADEIYGHFVCRLRERGRERRWERERERWAFPCFAAFLKENPPAFWQRLFLL